MLARRAPLVVAAAFAVSACARQDRTGAPLQAPATGTAARSTAGESPLALGIGITAYCAGADSLLRAVVAAHPPADATHPTAVSGPDSVTFSYEWARVTAPGCRVQAAGADTAARNGIVGTIDAALEHAGWQAADSLYMADGPDSSMRGFLRDSTLCLRDASWDGPDDSDSTYVPKPDFTVQLTCAPRRADDHPPS